MGQHTSENRALIEELKQDLIVNSILEEQVKQKSAEYTERLEALQLQVSEVLGWVWDVRQYLIVNSIPEEQGSTVHNLPFLPVHWLSMTERAVKSQVIHLSNIVLWTDVFNNTL